MELTPGYKQTEAGLIPADWETPLIGNLASFTSGSGISVASLSPESSDTPIPVYGGNGIAGFTAKALVYTPVVVVGRVGQKCGEVYLTDGPAWITDNALYPKVVHRSTDMRFLAMAMSMSGLNNLKNRNDLPLVTQSILHSVLIPLPPTEAEQRLIADTLTDVDAFVESLEQLLIKKRQIKQGAMQELLNGKKRLPGFKAKWPEKALGDLFHFSGGLSASRDQLGSEGLYYLHYGDIHSSTKTFVDVRTDGAEIPKLEIKVGMVSPKSLLADGDIVFVDASEDDEGTSRHVVIFNEDGIPFISGLHTIVAKSKRGELDCEYKRYCFQTSAVKLQFKFFAVGTKVSGISKTNIAKVNIPVPEAAEQAAIASILAAMDAEIEALEAKLAKARQLKQGMMQELLTGRIRLIRPSAQILSFPAKESASATDISHNTHFNEAVVIAVLSAKFGSETFPLGRFRRTKFSYLLHRHVEHEAAGFMKKAAGPYNPRTRYGGAEKIALQNRYVRVLSTGKSEGFVADENIAQAKGYFEKWYGAEALTWLEQFRYQKNDALELLTTVDMACQDLSRVGNAAMLSEVKQIIHDSPEWKAKLNRSVFSDDNIEITIKSCGQLFPFEEE